MKRRRQCPARVARRGTVEWRTSSYLNAASTGSETLRQAQGSTAGAAGRPSLTSRVTDVSASASRSTTMPSRRFRRCGTGMGWYRNDGGEGGGGLGGGGGGQGRGQAAPQGGRRSLGTPQQPGG